MTYRDFDLVIEPAASGLRARVLSSPAGQAAKDFSLPFSADKIENFVLRLGRTRRRRVRRAESSEMQAAKTFGATLFEAVFSGDIKTCFDASVDHARTAGAGLRIRLQVAASEAADVPWEYLYNPAMNRFLALSVHTPLVRYIDLPERVRPVPVAPPMRALVMISSPGDYPALDVESEWRKLNGALVHLIGRGVVAIDRLDEATLSALQRRLRTVRYNIFHFIGHGEFDVDSQEGVLILEGADHKGHRVGSQYLGMLLHDHRALRLAILNACEGARTSRVDPFAGSAQTLVQQGIPAVIAMQFEIADDVAGTFAHEFYGAVADGYPIDAAVTEARKAIFAGGRDVEWGTPVLYLRAPDGQIFDVQTSPPPAVAAESRNDPPAAVERAALDGETGPAILARQAGVALANGKYADALELLEELRAVDPANPNLAELTDNAQQQRAVAETRAARRRMFTEHVEAANQLFARGDSAAAAERLGHALRIRPKDPEALGLLARVIASDPPPPQRRAGSARKAAAGGGTSRARPRPADDERDLID